MLIVFCVSVLQAFGAWKASKDAEQRVCVHEMTASGRGHKSFRIRVSTAKGHPCASGTVGLSARNLGMLLKWEFVDLSLISVPD